VSGAVQPGPAVTAPPAASSYLPPSEAALMAAAQDLLSIPFPPPSIEVHFWW
jgi:hypothetical protein